MPMETRQKTNFSLLIKLLSVHCSSRSCCGRVDPSVLYFLSPLNCASSQCLLLKELQIKCFLWLLLPLCQSHPGLGCSVWGLVQPFCLASGAFNCITCSLDSPLGCLLPCAQACLGLRIEDAETNLSIPSRRWPWLAAG